MKKPSTTALTLLMITAFLAPIMVAPSEASPSPSVPEFTLSYHADDRSIVVSIKEQPFTSYQSYGQTIQLSYSIRYKSPGGEDWKTVFSPENEISYVEGTNVQTEGGYTIYTFQIGGTHSLGGEILSQEGGLVDFQVQTLIGSVHRDASQFLAPWVFDGERSDWSATKTVEVPLKTVTFTPTVPPTNPPETSPSGNQQNVYAVNVVEIVIVALLAVIAVLLAMAVFYLRKRTKIAAAA